MEPVRLRRNGRRKGILLLAGVAARWLGDETRGIPVFLKKTTDHRYPEVLADRRFLAMVHHVFLIRRPAEIVASYYALWPDMRIEEVGLRAL